MNAGARIEVRHYGIPPRARYAVFAQAAGDRPVAWQRVGIIGLVEARTLATQWSLKLGNAPIVFGQGCQS